LEGGKARGDVHLALDRIGVDAKESGTTDIREHKPALHKCGLTVVIDIKGGKNMQGKLGCFKRGKQPKT
jgi:hypothetical protein